MHRKIIAEIRQLSKPSFKSVIKDTVTVMLISIFCALIIGGIDLGMTNLIQFIL